jgi:hypothetical protein
LLDFAAASNNDRKEARITQTLNFASEYMERFKMEKSQENLFAIAGMAPLDVIAFISFVQIKIFQ